MITGNELAQPRIFEVANGVASTGGLTIRQYFAGLVMQGLLAAWGQHDVTDMADLANDAVIGADALIAELNKQP